jgi:hypothetical protein
MPIKLDPTTSNIDGHVQVGAGPEDARPMVGGNVQATPAQRTKCLGDIVVNPATKLLEYVPLDDDEFGAVIEADET